MEGCTCHVLMQFSIPSSALILQALLLNASTLFLKMGYVNKRYSEISICLIPLRA
jgi:hypothetical protein